MAVAEKVVNLDTSQGVQGLAKQEVILSSLAGGMKVVILVKLFTCLIYSFLWVGSMKLY